MARLKSPAKQHAILLAAVDEIAEVGLAAATAKIAARAGVATGTLFTYFTNKEELLSELYAELKNEVYSAINTDFPQQASLERRAWHIWSNFLNWAVKEPKKRKVLLQLTVSDLITPEARARVAAERGSIDATFEELEGRGALRELPHGFGAAAMSALQEVTMEFIAKQPRRRQQLSEDAFQLFWRALR
jgi:AcrR family transcriptional regulator